MLGPLSHEVNELCECSTVVTDVPESIETFKQLSNHAAACPSGRAFRYHRLCLVLVRSIPPNNSEKLFRTQYDLAPCAIAGLRRQRLSKEDGIVWIDAIRHDRCVVAWHALQSVIKFCPESSPE